MISESVLNQSEFTVAIDYFDTVYLAYQQAEAICDALVILDRARNLALYWVEHRERIPYWEMGTLLQSIFIDQIAQTIQQFSQER
jgi:hypothetical protein